MKNFIFGVGLASLFVAGSASFAAGDLRLIEAVKKSDISSVRSLLEAHTDINSLDADGSTALH